MCMEEAAPHRRCMLPRKHEYKHTAPKTASWLCVWAGGWARNIPADTLQPRGSGPSQPLPEQPRPLGVGMGLGSSWPRSGPASRHCC